MNISGSWIQSLAVRRTRSNKKYTCSSAFASRLCLASPSFRTFAAPVPLFAVIPLLLFTRMSYAARKRVICKVARESTLPATQVAACRCLGNFGGYAALSLPTLAPGSDAITIVVMSLDLLEELAEGLGRGGTVTSSQVRIRASWSLANMLDIDALPRCLPLQRLVQLCRSMLRLVAPGSGAIQRDLPLANPKVTPNAMRAIGNISRWLPLDDDDNGSTFVLHSCLLCCVRSSWAAGSDVLISLS